MKIMKWNDLNTVSLRQSINKAHRTLLKFMSRYREVLATGSGNVIARCTQQSNFTSLEPVLMQTFSTDALPVSHAVVRYYGCLFLTIFADFVREYAELFRLMLYTRPNPT